MEGISRLPGVRAAEYERTHPGVRIWHDWRTWFAWLPDGAAHADTEDELLAKLDGTP
jgi:hypothetical protein